MTRPTVIWAVLGDLSRSGVPVALERMVRWLATTGPTGVRCHVVAGRDGPLAGALSRSAASLTTFEPARGRSPVGSIAAAGAVAGRARTASAVRDGWYRHRVRHLPTPDVVLAHGAGSWATVEALGPRLAEARLVLHLHELEVAMSRSPLAAEPSAFSAADAVLAVCDPTAELAIARGTRPDRVTVVSGSVDRPPRGWSTAPRPPASIDVLSIGEAGWRKGTDRAVAAAWELDRAGSPVAWHWVGAPAASPWRAAVGSADPLIRHDARSDPWSPVPTPAGLVVPSREDPMPLVVLEAAARAIPVVATRTGGLPDLLAEGRGLVVDGADLRALVDAVRSLVDEPGRAAERARALRAHVRDHHATEVVGPRWLEAVLDR